MKLKRVRKEIRKTRKYLAVTPYDIQWPYDGLYGEAPPERGILLKLQVYERVER